MGKSKYQHEILHFQIRLGTKFRLKINPKTKKGISNFFKKKKITIEFYIFELVYVRNFSFNKQFWLLEKISKKRILPVENRKNEHQHRILHIRISLDTNFQLKLTILIFFTKFTKNGYFQSKTDKIDTPLNSALFKLVLVANFSFNFLN